MRRDGKGDGAEDGSALGAPDGNVDGTDDGSRVDAAAEPARRMLFLGFQRAVRRQTRAVAPSRARACNSAAVQLLNFR